MEFDGLPGAEQWGSSNDDDVFLGVGPAARMAGVSVDTVRRWCTSGRLPYRQGGPNNHRRILRSDLLALLAGEGTEPAIRHGGRRRLPDLLESWTDELDDLLPWRAGPLDNDQRITRLLVAIRGYSGESGRGGLIGKLLALVDDLEAAVSSPADPAIELYEPDVVESPPVSASSYLDSDDDDGGVPAFLQRLREEAARLDEQAGRAPTSGAE